MTTSEETPCVLEIVEDVTLVEFRPCPVWEVYKTPEDQRLEPAAAPPLVKKPAQSTTPVVWPTRDQLWPNAHGPPAKTHRVDRGFLAALQKTIETTPKWRKWMLKHGTDPGADIIAWHKFHHSWEYYLALLEAEVPVAWVPAQVLLAKPQLSVQQWQYFHTNGKTFPKSAVSVFKSITDS